MNKNIDNPRIHQRRRLLKGALAVSSVATLSRSGAAAAATSLGCIAKIASQDGGYPLDPFFLGDAPPAALGPWAWEEVELQLYQSVEGAQVEAFILRGGLYTPAGGNLTGLGYTLASGAADYPKRAWVLAYFNQQGEHIGSFPAITNTSVTEDLAPATASCLSSVNPGTASSFFHTGG